MSMVDGWDAFDESVDSPLPEQVSREKRFPKARIVVSALVILALTIGAGPQRHWAPFGVGLLILCSILWAAIRRRRVTGEWLAPLTEDERTSMRASRQRRRF